MRNDWRQFYVYDLEVKAQKAGAVIPDMMAVLAILENFKTARQTYEINGGAGVMLIGDIQVDAAQSIATLLVRLSDTLAPNMAYSNPATGVFTEHLKGAGEGLDTGCHVFISLLPEAGVPNVYTCIIERVQGISADIVRRLLSKFLNIEFHANPTSFQYPHPGGGNDRHGNPRRERCCPTIDLTGRPSQTFINDVNNGAISGISLLRYEVGNPIGGAAYLIPKETELRLSLDRGNLPANLWAGLTAAMRTQSATYAQAKMSYKIPGARRAVTIKINTATGQLIGDSYTESFEKGAINPLLSSSAQAIVAHLRDLVIPEVLTLRSV